MITFCRQRHRFWSSHLCITTSHKAKIPFCSRLFAKVRLLNHLLTRGGGELSRTNGIFRLFVEANFREQTGIFAYDPENFKRVRTDHRDQKKKIKPDVEVCGLLFLEREEPKTITKSLIALSRSFELLNLYFGCIFLLCCGTMALHVKSASVTLPANGGGSLTLKGRSRAGDGTTFFVEELKLMFDMGAIIQQACPEVVLLTHTHNDHITFMPQLLTARVKLTHVYLPAKAVPFVENYLRAHQDMVQCGEEPERGDPSKQYQLHGLDFGETFTLRIKGRDYKVTALKCNHRIDCLGFSVYRTTRPLKPEYKELTGKEIGQLRKAGTVTHDIVDVPFLCYLGDTTHGVFDNHPEILRQHKYIVVECSFFCENTEHQAVKTKHMHWKDLKPIVEANPGVLFILIHFSLRYSVQQIREFFVKQSTRNVHPMLVESELRQLAGGHNGRGVNVLQCNCFHCLEQQKHAKRPAEDSRVNRRGRSKDKRQKDSKRGRSKSKRK